MKLKNIIAGSILAASTVASTAALAESPLTANVGLSSNYIWRGVTQTADDSAISGGIDYAHDSGIYAGTWVSSLGGNSQYEQDWYAGFAFDAGPVGLDAGYIKYSYPINNANLDFSEVYLNASWNVLSGGVAYTVSKDGFDQKNDIYMYVGADFDLKKGLTLGLLYGNYNYDDPSLEDYAHYQVNLKKDDFTFALDKNDQSAAGADDIRFSVAYTKSFDLL